MMTRNGRQQQYAREMGAALPGQVRVTATASMASLNDTHMVDQATHALKDHTRRRMLRLPGDDQGIALAGSRC
jgi:hypothetical protein